jgi:hypothetical protein
MHTYIPATLSRVEHGMAVLALSDNQELRIPKEQLQPLPAVGSEMTIKVAPSTEAMLEKEALAKTLLNQLLGNES